MSVFLRHGEKEYGNKSSGPYRLDAGLTNDGKTFVVDKTKMLIPTYGVPRLIMTSPYLRTRETANIVQSTILEETGQEIPIETDVNLGECLCHQEGKDMTNAWRPETLVHNPITNESWNQYRKRIRAVDSTKDPSVWYITHGLNICNISKSYDTKKYYPRPFHGIIVEDGILKHL